MSKSKKYWNSLEHLETEAHFVEQAQKEFAQPIPVDEFLNNTDLDSGSTNRRDFLKFLGFSVTAATLAACEAPVVKAIPYVIKPEEVTPGVANYYASTYFDGHDYCSIVVKTREGRPIHIEGNKLSGLTRGGVNARVNSSVLSLYDSKRLQQPLKNGQVSDWKTIDSEISDQLKKTASQGGKIRILSRSLASLTANNLMKDWALKIGGDVKVVKYDALSYSAMIAANGQCFNKACIPSYRFDKAKTIVSIGADFLNDWLSSVENSKEYGMRRKPEADWMSKHYQFESIMSLSGSNADVRVAVKPSEYGKVALAIYNGLVQKSGASPLQSVQFSDDSQMVTDKIKKVVEDLWTSKGESLVIAGSNDKDIQVMVNGINSLLVNYGTTISLAMEQNIKEGNSDNLTELLRELNAGEVSALILNDVDPIYAMPSKWNFKAALAKVKMSVAITQYMDETASSCTYVAPSNHYLESWGDIHPKRGYYSLMQPTINSVYNTRQAENSLMNWAGMSGDYQAYLKKSWNEYEFSKQTKHSNFTAFWNSSLRDGVIELPESVSHDYDYQFMGNLEASAAAIAGVKAGEWEMELYVKTGIGFGNQANNPWLQELPDPITKTVWDNYVTMNPMDMKAFGFETYMGQQNMANVVAVSCSEGEVSLPVFPSPGQKRKTIGIALGYGKGKVGEELIGKNVFPLSSDRSGHIAYNNFDVKIADTASTYAIATSQTHNTMMGRKIVNETTIDVFAKGDRSLYNEQLKLSDAYGEKKTTRELDLWQEHDVETFGHRWGMTIDLNACTGCGACVTACHSENNVPVVGKDEVRRNRDMFWLRIDRYFSSDMTKEKGKAEDVGAISMYKQMEDSSEYPQVVHQPVMCQHCNHAPCETVCPVAATTHSNEGLNQMAYNRCVGTRYCANNCPYKVRRFNWFQYDSYKKFTDVNPAQSDMGRMVLNPDVVVRSRGVMEKCSMCVQRIQTGKLDAKKLGKAIVDGDVQTACATACPTNAIVFGDINDKASEVAKTQDNNRAYHLLEEVGTQPNVMYMTKVRNISSKEA